MLQVSEFHPKKSPKYQLSSETLQKFSKSQKCVQIWNLSRVVKIHQGGRNPSEVVKIYQRGSFSQGVVRIHQGWSKSTRGGQNLIGSESIKKCFLFVARSIPSLLVLGPRRHDVFTYDRCALDHAQGGSKKRFFVIESLPLQIRCSMASRKHM